MVVLRPKVYADSAGEGVCGCSCKSFKGLKVGPATYTSFLYFSQKYSRLHLSSDFSFVFRSSKFLFISTDTSFAGPVVEA